jgi:alanine--tRNA ligase
MAPDALRALCETVKNEAETIVCVLAAVQTEKGSVNFAASCAKGAVQAGAHAGNLVRAVAKAAGGSGGGKPDAAMAGGKDASKVEAALAAASSTLAGMLKA